MTEAIQSYEATSPRNVEVLQNMLSDEALAHRAIYISEQLAGEHDGAVGHVSRLYSRAKDIEERGITENNGDDYSHAAERAREVRGYAARIFGKEAVYSYHSASTAAYNLSAGRVISWGKEAQHLYETFMGDSEVIDDGIDRDSVTPPAAQGNAPVEEYVDYLQQKKFVPYGLLKNLATERSVVIKLAPDAQVIVPIQNVVSASLFSSWAGRGPNGNDIKQREAGIKKQSNEYIKDYAEKPSDIPPTEGIEAFMQPNGVVLYAVQGSNHRTAAAIARGQTELTVGSDITFRLLSSNIADFEALPLKVK